MLQVTSKTQIYIVAAAGHAAGGVESLHQLCHSLREQGYNAFMYYLPVGTKNPVHANYLKYSIQVATEISDKQDNIIVVPEVATYLLYRFKKIQKAIFWLSVDNYYVSLNLDREKKKNLRYWIKKAIGYERVFSIEDGAKEAIVHFSQSKYAIEHLAGFGIAGVFYIPDYIHSSFTHKKPTQGERKNIVLYNPLKGFEVTTQLMNIAKDLEWRALENLSPQEVADTLCSSKVYIDFGNHPGKDRFPREAALSGCCVITGKRGSAFYDEDIMLPSRYKFNDSEHEAIIEAIRSCINDYDTIIGDFDCYIKFINEHELQLNSLLPNVFVRKF